MREIRFRVWDKCGKRIRYLGNDTHDSIMFDYSSGAATMEEDCPEYGFSPLMQYTGLKDKNGKEIYEGDIVEVEATCIGGRDFKGVVKFYECGFFIDNGKDAIPLFDEVNPRIILGNAMRMLSY